MLYLLTNNQKQAEWQAPYEQLFTRELLKKNYPLALITEETIDDIMFTSQDYLWVMHYKDLSLAGEIKKATGCRVISTANGTAANPYIYQVNRDEEEYQMSAIIDICLIFNTRQKIAMKQFYPKPYYIETGFPVEVPKLSTNKTPKTIIVPGRISPDRQFLLATYLLKPLKDAGYRITFAIPEREQEASKKWFLAYDAVKFMRLGFHINTYSREDFLKQLALSEFVFLCSLGDICSVSLAEALLLDCYPIVPHFKTGLPTYDEAVSFGYEPFNQSEVVSMIKGKLRQKILWQQELYDPEKCATKFIEGLKNYVK